MPVVLLLRSWHKIPAATGGCCSTSWSVRFGLRQGFLFATAFSVRKVLHADFAATTQADAPPGHGCDPITVNAGDAAGHLTVGLFRFMTVSSNLTGPVLARVRCTVTVGSFFNKNHWVKHAIRCDAASDSGATSIWSRACASRPNGPTASLKRVNRGGTGSCSADSPSTTHPAAVQTPATGLIGHQP